VVEGFPPAGSSGKAGFTESERHKHRLNSHQHKVNARFNIISLEVFIYDHIDENEYRRTYMNFIPQLGI